MANILIRGLPDAVAAAIKLEARAQGRKTEAQIRLMLERAVLPGGRRRLGTMLARIGQQTEGFELLMLLDRRQPLTMPETEEDGL